MTEKNDGTKSGGLALREREWGLRLAFLTMAYLLFESVTGLAIYFLPFSVSNQWTVIVHTVVGLLVLLPALVYQFRHLSVYWERPMSAIKAMGYLAFAATLVAAVSGLILTWQAAFGTKLLYALDRVHLVSTFALLAFTLPHVAVILIRDRLVGLQAAAAPLLRAESRAMVLTVVTAIGFALPIALLAYLYPGPELNNEFPADYSYKFGKDRPFAPSLAKTATGGAYDSRSLSGSQSCGTAGCHEEIAKEWSVSAHRWSAMDAGFQRVQTEMGKQNGPESTRYCGGCHDPISLFSGTKNLFTKNLTSLAGYQEGVSCLVCHSVRKTDLKGNANYIVAQPSRYLFELADSGGSRFMRDFLLRGYPRKHVADYSKKLFKTPEYCAACHKQFIDKEVNNVGWVQLQNQYDNWRKSRWNTPGDPTKTIECRECHMPLVASHDPASGDDRDYNRTPGDRKHRSHRFVAANQLMPALLKLDGGKEQIDLTNKWLRGELPIPEIASKWKTGPAVRLDFEAPKAIAPGEPVKLKAVITSNKVGHDFPTGPLDIIQAWIQITVTDADGNVVYHSGKVDEKHFVEKGSFMFKAEPVDQYGNLIDRHNLWEMVGVRYKRSLFPGFSDSVDYAFKCPGNASQAATPTEAARSFEFKTAAAGPLKVTGRILYRKLDQYLLNFLFGEDAGLTAPITEMASAETTIDVKPQTVAALTTP